MFPCKLRILPNCVFNSRDPIVVGVVVEGGQCKPGMPLTIPSKNVSVVLWTVFASPLVSWDLRFLGLNV